MYQETTLTPNPPRAAVRTVSYGQIMITASLNVNPPAKPSMHTQIESYLQERDIDLLCAQDTTLALATQCVVGDLLYVLPGHGGQYQEHAWGGHGSQARPPGLHIRI